MSDLPKDWTVTTLGEICSKPQYGWTSKASREGRIKYLRTTDISDGHIDWESVPFCELEPDSVEKYQIRKNDILVSRAGSVGISYRIEEIPYETVFASYLIRFNPLECALPQYVEFYLKSHDYWTSISESSAGIAIPNVNATKLAEIEMPLAPLNEQKRIVEKLEKLLGKVETVQARLDKIPAILKRFRQAVLAAACSGKLTADWRENKEINLETDLPIDWKIVELQKYAKCSRGRFSIRPRNDPRYFDGEYPFIQIGNIPSFGGFITSHKQTLNEKGLAVSKMFPKGTVVIAIVGATIGNTGILAYDMSFTDSMVGIETGTDFGNKYVELFLRSKKDDIRQSSYAGGGQPNIKLETLNPYPINLPPLEEQKEIVRRVEDLFKFADQIEARYKKARSYTDKLTQSILAKAFRGELVPQDETDEPADILLERIKKEQNDKNTVAKTKIKKNNKLKPKTKNVAQGNLPY